MILNFEAALGELPKVLHDAVRAHWQELITAAERFGVNLPDKIDFEQLVRVLAGSDFVARSFVRDPRLFVELLESGDLLRGYSEGYRRAVAGASMRVTNEEQLGEALRRFRRREMVRIIWRELAGLAVPTETLADLSTLADAVIDYALETLYDWQCDQLGTPRDSGGKAQRLIVLGMGKLGGRELNLSSDIDLIFVFPQQGQTGGGARTISNEEFFRRLGQRLIRALQEPTGEGFVFRVDMRLRPFGDAGPLVMPFGAFEDYYQRHGRDWERYAMIKARVVAGDREAGAELLEHLRPFVYRRYLDYGAFEALRSMKQMIAREVERRGMEANIKLGPGGIREIEFIAQAFQLIYGGREPALRERSILRVLDYLHAAGKLPSDTIEGLRSAYIFLRRTENCIQAWADQQTHNLPSEDLGRARLAYVMGFRDHDAFESELRAHTHFVAEQFARVFAASQAKAERQNADLDFASVWNELLGVDAAIGLLGEHGFDEPEQALAILRRLRASFNYRALSPQGRERMEQLMPLLMRALTHVPGPTETLERVSRLLEAVARRSVYLALLVERPTVLEQLVRLCSASVRIAEHLMRYPILLDDLLDPRRLYSPLDRPKLQEELEQMLTRVISDDAEQVLDTLRHFKQSNVLRVAAADVEGAVPLMVVSDYLTEIAIVLTGKVLELAWADLETRFGRPSCRIGDRQLEPGFAIVAYGKLGGIELGYGSDLDLVFLHDSAGQCQQTRGGPREIDNATFFTRLTQRIIHLLTAPTGAGFLYEVDTRLRPSGRSGLLVSSIDAFAKYQREQAWTWEHQALVRARVVAGSPMLAERFAALRREVLGRQRDVLELKQQVREMRERMRTELSSGQPDLFDLKQDRGGIADIEFMVQYEVLANAHRYPELLTFTDNIRQLDGLEQAGVMTSADATLLRDAYRTLRRRSHLLKLQERSSVIDAQDLVDYREGVVRIWRALMEG